MSDLRTSLLSKIGLDHSRVKPYQGFIFLCGGPADIRSALPISLRDAVYRELAKNDDDLRRIRMAEHYKDWAHDSIYNDLVLFERHLAELSSIIVLVLESPGAIAELGLFSTIDEFREKLLVFIDGAHYQSDSFIKFGPIDFLEKTHKNSAEVYRWHKEYGSKLVFDGELAAGLQEEVAEAIRTRLSRGTAEHPFRCDQWLHCALLICDLIDLLSALTLREIRKILSDLGVEKTELEVKQALYLLERVELIAMEPKGDQRFYVGIVGHQFLRLHVADGPLDYDRFRSDIISEYQQTDKRRFRAIQEVRRRQ